MQNYKRYFQSESSESYFLFGPRGTGKTTWLKEECSDALVIDLLNPSQQLSFTARPERLKEIVEGALNRRTFVIDEIQKVPSMLNVVHSLIETHPEIQFILTGSSARKLRKAGVDLLGGRALEYHMHPFMACELGDDFSINEALQTGMVPVIRKFANRQRALASYVGLYIKEEVEQEGLVRNLDSFSRFLEAMSFTHSSVYSATSISNDCFVKRTTVEAYVSILEDLLLGSRLKVFSRRSKRQVIAHDKFYFFDTGVFRALRPKGPLDSPAEIDGAALEGLVHQHLKAWCDYSGCNDALFYWRTHTNHEVDFVIYSENNFTAIEVKNASRLNSKDFSGLRLFGEDYPEAQRILLYRGSEQYLQNGVLVVPAEKYLKELIPGQPLPR